METEDTYEIKELEGFSVEVLDVLTLRFGNVRIEAKSGQVELEMRLLCDTVDLAKYNTPEKIRKAVTWSSRRFASDSAERSVKLEEKETAGRFGARADFTDASLEGKTVPEGEHRVVRVGMQSLSDNAVVAYFLYYNDSSDVQVQQAMDYMHSLIRARPTTQPARNWQVGREIRPDGASATQREDPH